MVRLCDITERISCAHPPSLYIFFLSEWPEGISKVLYDVHDDPSLEITFFKKKRIDHDGKNEIKRFWWEDVNNLYFGIYIKHKRRC